MNVQYEQTNGKKWEQWEKGSKVDCNFNHNPFGSVQNSKVQMPCFGTHTHNHVINYITIVC